VGGSINIAGSQIITTATIGSYLTPGSPPPKIVSYVINTDSSYTSVSTATAVSTYGGYITISGTNFLSIPQVIIGSQLATAVSYVSSTTLLVQIPAQVNNGTYPLYVINSDGGTAINVPGITYNDFPVWSSGYSLGNYLKNSAISIQLAATDSNPNIIYSLALGNSLPSGLTLTSAGYLSGSVSNQATYNFTIVAQDIYAQQTSQAFVIFITTYSVDPLFNYVTLLLNNASAASSTATNNLFLDSSVNNFAIAATGTPTQGTFSPFGSNGWSWYFDGSSSFFNLPVNSPGLFLGSNNFTIEAWVYSLSSSTTYYLISGQSDASTIGGSSWGLAYGLTNFFNFNQGSSSQSNYSFTAPTVNQWNHLAVVRNVSTVTIYLNGLYAGGGAISGSINNGSSANPPIVGRYINQALGYVSGYVSNLRVVNGTAVYTGTFTVSTIPLTVTYSGTTLLTCQSPYMIDSSPGNLVVSSTNVYTRSFSPFLPALSSSTVTTSTIYSQFFDGSSGYLTVPSNTAWALGTTGTIECWIYLTGTLPNSLRIVNVTNNSTNIDVYVNSTYQVVLHGGTVSTPTNVITPNVWAHVAVVYNSGTVSIYINGVSQTLTGTTTGYNISNTGILYIGQLSSGGAYYWTGYISNLRIVKGTAVYTTNFTVPTSPLTTATTSTVLLTCQTSVIQDASTNTFVITTTARSFPSAFSAFPSYQFGTTYTNPVPWSAPLGSIYGNGTNSYLSTPYSPTLLLNGQNFTIECWIYPIAAVANRASGGSPGYQNIFGQGIGAYSGQYNINIALGMDASNLYLIGPGATYVTTPSSNVIQYAWNHIAATVTSGSTGTIYINGVAKASGAITPVGSNTSYQNNFFGNYLTGGGTNSYLQAYVSQLRITKSLVYTGNFIPPTVPLTTITNTVLMLNGTNLATYDLSSRNDINTIGTQITTSNGPFSVPITTSGGSMYFNGSSYFTRSYSTSLSFVSTAFTIEMWVYPTTVSGSSGQQYLASLWGVVGQSDNTYSSYGFMFVNNNLSINVNNGSSNTTLTGSGGGVTNNVWQHIAVVKSGTNATLYLNGIAVGTSTSFPSTLNDPTASTFVIGAQLQTPATYYYNGYISNLRITKGLSLYNANFTPSTVPLTTTTNTQLLTFQNTTPVKDVSTNSFTLTQFSSTIPSVSGPFIPNGNYSGYFNGSSYLNVPNSSTLYLNYNPFTIEAWVYPTVSIAANTGLPVMTMYQSFTTGAESSFQFYLSADASGNAIVVTTWVYGTTQTNNPTLTGTIPLVPNRWYHILVSRQYPTIYYFVNGVSVGSGSYIGGVNQGSLPLFIGARRTNTGSIDAYFTGYISNIRITNGVALYTTNFTPSTVPLTTTSNTALLTIQSNLFKDNSVNSQTVTLFGSPAISGFSPFQTSTINQSVVFTPSLTAYLQAPPIPDYKLGYTNWTIDGWFFFNNVSTNQILNSYGYEATTARSYILYLNNDGTLHFAYSTNGSDNTDTSFGASGCRVGQWYYIAVVRNATIITAYINGVALPTTITIGTTAIYYPGSSAAFRIGLDSTNYLNGYVADFRISRGIARYTSSFALPSTDPSPI
jgi:hypothetical protein